MQLRTVAALQFWLQRGPLYKFLPYAINVAESRYDNQLAAIHAGPDNFIAWLQFKFHQCVCYEHR